MNLSKRIPGRILTKLALLPILSTLPQACFFFSEKRDDSSSSSSSSDSGTSGDSDSSSGSGGSSTSSHSASLDPANATLSSSTYLSLTNGSAEVGLKAISTSSVDFCNHAGGYSANDGVSSVGGWSNNAFTQLDMTYTPSSNVTVNSIQPDIYRSVASGAGPTGGILVAIYGDSSGNPGVPGTLVGKSDPLSAASISDGYNRFVFANPLSLSASTTYHIVLAGDTDYSADGSYSSGTGKISWYYTTARTNCSTSVFGDRIGSLDSMSTWYNLDAQGWLTKVERITFSTSAPTVTFAAADAGSSSPWDLSTFVATEHGASGTITYDVGVSEDGTATYSLSGKTKSQIQAGGTLTGRYLHLRATFTSDGNKASSVKSISVSYTN